MKNLKSVNPLHPTVKELQRLRDEERREELAKSEAQKQLDAIVSNPKMDRIDKEQKAWSLQLRINLINGSEPSRKQVIADLECDLRHELDRQKAAIADRLRKMADDTIEAYFAAITPFFEDAQQARRQQKGVELPAVRALRRDAMRFDLRNGHEGLPIEEQVAHYLSNLATAEKKYGWTE